MSTAIQLPPAETRITAYAYVPYSDRVRWAAKAKDGAQFAAWKAGNWVHTDDGAVPEGQVAS